MARNWTFSPGSSSGVMDWITITEPVTEAEVSHADGPAMLRFETLTLVPFDVRLIETGLLSNEETHWINDYHARVSEALLPHLGEQDRAWLKQATRMIE